VVEIKKASGKVDYRAREGLLRKKIKFQGGGGEFAEYKFHERQSRKNLKGQQRP